MLRPTQTMILLYSRTRNGTNINFTAVFISMLNSRFLIYKNLSHYSNSATEMFQWKQGIMNQKQRMIFVRRYAKKPKTSHWETHFSATQNISFVSETLSEPYSLAIPHLAFLFHFNSPRSTVISHQEIVAG